MTRTELIKQLQENAPWCSNATCDLQIKAADMLEADGQLIDALRQAIEQASKVEPVGTVVEDDNDFGRVKALLDQDARVQLAVGTQLYTHPPTAQPAKRAYQVPTPDHVAYECPKSCGCWWRDNRDGTMSLFNGEHKSCSVCENLPLNDLRPVSIADHLFIERRDGDNWLVCVERVFKGEEEAKKACQKWQSYTHLPTAPAQPLNDFDMRGVLASKLLCWHRLTEAEAQDLVCFFENVRRTGASL